MSQGFKDLASIVYFCGGQRHLSRVADGTGPAKLQALAIEIYRGVCTVRLMSAPGFEARRQDCVKMVRLDSPGVAGTHGTLSIMRRAWSENVAKRAKEIQGLHDFRSWSAGSWRATSVKRRAAMRSTKFCARRRV